MRGRDIKHFFLILLLIIPDSVFGQEYVYVNTDSLILRDRPEKIYTVFAILHVPSQLKIVANDNGYINDKAVNARFYQVSFTHWKQDGTSLTKYGWVEKKYTVRSKAAITVPGADTTADLLFTDVPSIPYIGSDEKDPNPVNCAKFPYPRYKGGEKHFDLPVKNKRVYHTGPRGGCYYLSGKGRKVYVDKKFCK